MNINELMRGRRTSFAPLRLRILAIGAFMVALGAQSPVQATGDLLPPIPKPRVPKPTFTWIASPNFDDRPGGEVVDTIVIHDTETPGIRLARTIASHFASPRSGVSAHFIIGKAGEIVQCVPEGKRAFHAGPSLFRGRERVNDFSVGIELVNAQTGVDPFTDAQYGSLGQLVAYLVDRFDVPFDRIVGHHDVTLRPWAKRDPAINFDWDRMYANADGWGLQRVSHRPRPGRKT